MPCFITVEELGGEVLKELGDLLLLPLVLALVVIDGVTWIDNEGTDRRRKVRRKDDRERIARQILDDTLMAES